MLVETVAYYQLVSYLKSNFLSSDGRNLAEPLAELVAPLMNKYVRQEEIEAKLPEVTDFMVKNGFVPMPYYGFGTLEYCFAVQLLSNFREAGKLKLPHAR